ncbi:MAG: DUF222 domain-containing protein [Propionicimonas sp.]|uniref:HNH endonuclease signature motif containing protein n=1 Tax=Propionicimonas sp. TaxID=1955623 RepID=UPI003D13B4E9
MDTTGLLPAGEAIDQITALLDRIDTARAGVDAATRLRWVRSARVAHQRLGALASVLTGEADRAKASERTSGTPLSSWLGTGEVLSRREAAGAVKAGRELVEHPDLAEAATGGHVNGAQTRSIGRVLGALAPQLDPSQQVRAEQVLVGLAATMDADQLRNAAGRVLEEVAPVEANALAETLLQREHEAAVRGRFFRHHFDGGSMLFEGSVPKADGAQLLALVQAHADRLRRTAIETRDPLTNITTGEQRRADAFVAMVRSAGEGGADNRAPAARVIVKLDYDKLICGAAGAGVLDDGSPLSAGELRRLCCGAGVLPVVVDGKSAPLDVGYEQRLVTRAQRAALHVRDGGCAFPGCDLAAGSCEAHHIVPWWEGGRTDLSNLVLLCRHHHGVIEPARYGLRDQWSVEIAEDGLPEFLPPARYGPPRRPMRNRRSTPLDDTG